MQEYNYQYAGADFYCYPETKVLVNRFEIKDGDKLEEIERKIVAAKAVDFESLSIIEDFSLQYLCAIHQYLFGDVYEWAGRIRGGDYMFKGDTMFYRAIYIEQGFSDYYEKLKKEDYLKNLDKN